MNSLLGKNSFGARGGAVYSAAVCMYVFVSLVVSLIISGAGLTGDASAYVGYLCSPVALVVAFALACLYLRTPLRAAAPVRCHPKYYLISLLAVFGLLFAVSPVNSLFVGLLKYAGYSPADALLPSLEGGGMAGALIVVAVLPAVAEELVFRGAILYNADRGAGTVGAVFLTAFVFALYHGSVEQTIYQFICGVVFALIAVRSGSVLPSMLAHFVNNAVIIVLTGLSLVGADGYVLMPGWAVVLVASFAGLSLVGAVVWLVLDKKPLRPRVKGETAGFFVWGALGLFIMFLVWLLTLLRGFGVGV